MPLADAVGVAAVEPCDDDLLLVDIDVGEDLDAAAQGPWALSSSEDEADAVRPESSSCPATDNFFREVDAAWRVPRRSVFDLVAHGRRPSGVPSPSGVPPPPPHPAPRDPAGPRPAPRRSAPVFVARRDFRSNWPKYLHSQSGRSSNNYLRVSRTFGNEHADMRAVCSEHDGQVCSLSRSCRSGRPIGLLWWWLAQGKGKTKEQHQWPHCIPSREDRVAARAAFEALDNIDEFVSAESGGAGLGEP